MLVIGRISKVVVFSLLLFSIVSPSVSAAKAIFGKVVGIESAVSVTIDDGGARHKIRVAGIEAPADEPFASAAKRFVTDRVLGRNVRLRFLSRSPDGELLGRLDVEDPDTGPKEVAADLVREGLARVQPGFDRELAKAETEARDARRGLWSISAK